MTVVVVLAALAVVLTVRYVKSQQAPEEIDLQVIRTKGDPSAEVKVIEYFDFQCPACAFGAKALEEYYARFPNKIFIQAKYYPLSGHQHAMTAAKYAECSARQGVFWPMYNLLFGRQNQWSRMVDARPAFDLMVKELKLNQKAIEACIEDPEILAAIMKDKREGNLIGIRSTPTFLVNQEVVVGFKSLAEKLSSLFEDNEVEN